MPSTARVVRKLTGGISRTSLRKNTNAYTLWVVAVAEAIWNEFDAGATKILCKMVKRGNKIDLWIWGNGLGIQRWEPIVSLLDSPSAKDPGKRGKDGSGCKAGLRHAKELVFMSLLAGQRQLQTVGFTADELEAILHDGVQPDLKEMEIPADSPLAGHGTLLVWKDIGNGPVMYVDHKEDRSFDLLLAGLAGPLPRKVVKTLTLIDTAGNRHTLAPRKLVGELIELVGEIPGLGPVSCEVAVTTKPNRHDSLMVWAHDPGCSIGQFLRHAARVPANKDLAMSIAKVLDSPLILGEVTCVAFADYSIRGANAGFMQSLFADEETVFLFLQWLQTGLVPKVLALLGGPQEEDTNDDRLAEALVERFQRIGAAPSDDTDTHDLDTGKLATTPSIITLECGDSCWIEVGRVPDGITPTWNPTNAGGKLGQNTGKRVHFTAGAQPGDFRLILHVGNLVHRVRVELKQRLTPRLRQRTRTGEPDQIITWKLDYPKHIVGQLTWKLGDGDSGTLEVSKDTLSARHRLPQVSDRAREINIEGRLDDGTTMRLNGIVMVAPPVPSRSKSSARRPSKTEWVINGHTYELVLLRGYAAKDLQPCFIDPDDADDRTKITLNMTHPKFDGTAALAERVAELEVTAAIAGDELRRRQNDLDTMRSLNAEELIQQVSERSNELFTMLRGLAT
ncbi:MAG: hypothetical protein HQ488_01535 [Parcubacteria group bacterium]|nr:hypothetical protein [Parcubacteria group bacterium]